MTSDFLLSFCSVPDRLRYDTRKVLTPGEQALLGEKATSKRTLDFIAGRIAAKNAIRFYLKLNNDIPLSILRVEEGDKAGKPYAILEENNSSLDIHVSITHADGKAYAVVSRKPIGIDNVTIETYGSSFRNAVFQEGELQGWADWLGVHEQDSLAVCTGFAAKEAFLKWMDVGLRHSLPMIRISPIVQPDAVLPNVFFQASFGAVCRISSHSTEITACHLDGYYARVNGQVIIMMIGESSY